MPILTRLYNPKDFGLLSLFASITAIIGTIINGRFELAIVLPSKQKEAINIFQLGFVINLILSFILIFILILFNNFFYNLFNQSYIFYLIPLGCSAIGFQNLIIYFFNRNKKYKNISLFNISNSLISSFLKLILGLIKSSYKGLIIGNIIPLFLLDNYIFLKYKKIFFNFKNFKFIETFKKYKNLIILYTPAAILNVLSFQLPIFFIKTLFNTEILGFYSLAYRTLNIPASIIGGAIGQVFYQKANQIYIEKKYNHLFNFSIKLFLGLFFIYLIPFTLIFIFGDKIYQIIFGNIWRQSGEISKILSLWVICELTITPFTNFFLILKKDKAILYFNILTIIIRTLTLLTGKFLNFETTLIYYVIGNNCIVFGKFFYFLYHLNTLKIQKQ